MTTGITTGPIALSNGGTFSLNDPHIYSTFATNIQIQNSTGYVVFIQSAGAGYNIQPYTATTIPTNYGQTLVGTATNTGNVTTGSLYAVWLLEGQDPPINNGPLTVNPVTSHGVTTSITTGSWVIGGAGQYFGTDNTITVNYFCNSLYSGFNYLYLAPSSGGTPNIGPIAYSLGQGSAIFSFPNGIPNVSFGLWFGTSTSGPQQPVQTQFSNVTAYASN